MILAFFIILLNGFFFNYQWFRALLLMYNMTIFEEKKFHLFSKRGHKKISNFFSSKIVVLYIKRSVLDHWWSIKNPFSKILKNAEVIAKKARKFFFLPICPFFVVFANNFHTKAHFVINTLYDYFFFHSFVLKNPLKFMRKQIITK